MYSISKEVRPSSWRVPQTNAGTSSCGLVVEHEVEPHESGNLLHLSTHNSHEHTQNILTKVRPTLKVNVRGVFFALRDTSRVPRVELERSRVRVSCSTPKCVPYPACTDKKLLATAEGHIANSSRVPGTKSLYI